MASTGGQQGSGAAATAPATNTSTTTSSSTTPSNASETASKKREEKKISKISHKDFDLEGYISQYTGHTKILRLLFIGDRCDEHSIAAYKMAIDEIKKTNNTALYKEAFEKVGEALGPGYLKDQDWIETNDKRAIQLIERLENELNQYKTSLIKESIRMSHNDLGDAHYGRGDLGTALKCYVRTRDYCTTSKHIIQMCLNVIKVSIESGSFGHVPGYINKAEQTPDLTDNVVIAKLKVSAGLAALEGRKYKHAARKFLETTPDLSNNFNDVIAPRDVAIYGGLCALATFDRIELKKKVLDNAAFKNFLELVPQVRELLNDFYGSRYASCLNYLDQLKNDLLLDIHLYDHVGALYHMIRNKALVQYFSPFISVDLNTMAAAFNTDTAGLEKELSGLILEQEIQARIDSHNKVLHARRTNQRSATFEKALKMGDVYQQNTKAFVITS